MASPNILLILTDQERYPPPYETDAAAAFRRARLPGRERLREAGIELHRHYAASTACVASRASLFTGHYPSLHGVSQTDGLAKSASDPAMMWLDPNAVPTMGDWFRAAGYRTEYRGKWHISHADLPIPGSHEGLRTNDRSGNVRPEIVAAYRGANRLDPFGFSGWIGREPHGADPADTGYVRDGLFADQVEELFATLAADRSRPWLAVASLVNPHDVAFSGAGWQLMGFPEPDDTVPDPGEPPSQTDSFAGRPRCHETFRDLWAAMLYEQPRDAAYRRFYLWLHEVVDRAVDRIVRTLDASGMAEDTIVVFTSDHGEMLGAHGGLQQKWYNAFDETVRVPMLVRGPGVPAGTGTTVPTSHADLLPTLLGFAGVDVEHIARLVAQDHYEAQPLVGRDLSAALTSGHGDLLEHAPIYFMTEDQISRGLNAANRITGKPYEPVEDPANVESVVATLTDADGHETLWKLNHYYERLPEWEESVGIAPAPTTGEPPASEWELHDLSADPQERRNLATSDGAPIDQLRALMATARDAHRRAPAVRNG
jgi:arylsulfatase A-like enzyme